jgi:septal ring factor EnvC (AmiA/AmiB activator)
MNLQEMAGAILGLQTNQARIDAALAAKASEHADETKTLSSRIAQLEGDLTTAKATIATLEAARAALDTERTALSARITTTESALKDSEAKQADFDGRVKSAVAVESARIVAGMGIPPIKGDSKDGHAQQAQGAKPVGLAAYKASVAAQLAKQ